MQSSVLTGGEEGRQSQEQNEVDHGDFEMVVSKRHLNWKFFCNINTTLLICRKGTYVFSKL